MTVISELVLPEAPQIRLNEDHALSTQGIKANRNKEFQIKLSGQEVYDC